MTDSLGQHQSLSVSNIVHALKNAYEARAFRDPRARARMLDVAAEYEARLNKRSGNSKSPDNKWRQPNTDMYSRSLPLLHPSRPDTPRPSGTVPGVKV